jgi:cation diffusion facilitator family transporter
LGLPPRSLSEAHCQSRAAYFHVLADALTSVLAIFALLAGKYFGWSWMDPLSGIVGAILVSRWSLGLIRASSEVLLDKQAASLLSEIKEALAQEPDTTLADLHVWCIGPNIYSAIVTIVTPSPKSPCHYRQLLASVHELVHITVEVNQL